MRFCIDKLTKYGMDEGSITSEKVIKSSRGAGSPLIYLVSGRLLSVICCGIPGSGCGPVCEKELIHQSGSLIKDTA